jgi:outer membrane receptor protein involved in Fe transport
MPVMSNAYKALNMRRTKTQGIDFRSELRWLDTDVSLSYSRLLPYDYSRSQLRVIPGVPQSIFVAAIEKSLVDVTVRWMARYRSSVYKDLANTVELPGATVHDASVDWRSKVARTELHGGFSVRNVLDLKSVDVSAPSSEALQNKGKTGYSDMSGGVLPGRQWVLSLAAKI